MDAATATALSKPYWEGAEEGRLVLQKCGHCGKVRHYPRTLCDACYSFKAESVDARGTGTVHSWTVAHHAFHLSVADETPYELVTVDLDEGVRILGRMDVAGELRLGLPVRVTFRRNADGIPIPVFVSEGSTP
jgi:uncharacterized protein